MGEIDSYVPPAVLFNRHLETIYPSLFRKVPFRSPRRERIFTPDDDFLDLDWYEQGSSQVVIISHGLEGNSQRSYVLGMARAFFLAGYDVLAWNYRGCSGEINRQLRFYHSGATDDLHTVVTHAASRYGDIHLVGFSLGGNLTLKYLGEHWAHPRVKRAVALSVPLNLHTSCLVISRPSNWIYTKRFLLSLSAKVKAKPDLARVVDVKKLDTLRTLLEFDDHFTGPLHGFSGAIDYYHRCSSIHALPHIRVPALLLNAQNDPFLSEDCYPREQFENVITEYPHRGGHVGFARFDRNGLYWSEMKAVAFVKQTE
ncbi:MAG: alpha/beta fold hydrolase [Cyclobacteriaceae bacterium]|nr:alpha/beta fold hydrolase [Cyclobacteriaceae bacterium]